MVTESGDKWIDDDGLMRLEPMPSPVPENAILFTVTYWLLHNFDIRKCFTYEDFLGRKIRAKRVLESLERDGVLYEAPVNKKEPTSHDNMTAIITMMVILNMPINHLKIFHRYYHPRDFIYMGYLQRRWWAYPLLPLLLIIFLHMALTKYKKRNGKKIFKTDTEILFWIRINLPERFRFIHWTKRLIVPLLKRKYDEEWVQAMMDIYYKNPNHPNRNFK